MSKIDDQFNQQITWMLAPAIQSFHNKIREQMRLEAEKIIEQAANEITQEMFGEIAKHYDMLDRRFILKADFFKVGEVKPAIQITKKD